MASLVDSADVAYQLSDDYRLIDVNGAFWRSAHDNGGFSDRERWRREPIFNAMSGPLRAHFVEAFERARREATPWTHEYECSSATRKRTFHMTVYPVGNEFVVVHALRFDGPHTRIAAPPDVRAYLHDGLVTMCSECRRVKHATEERRWDWIPAYLTHAPAVVSHGLCEPCARFYWP